MVILVLCPSAQHPPGGKRTDSENAAFKRALDVMGDVYASAVGTTVLQIKEIPPRPTQCDGVLCLFNLKVDKEKVLESLEPVGLVSVDIQCPPHPTVARFATHEAALAAMRTASWPELCDGVDTQYNERSYDGRRGEQGRADDSGRGWCAVHHPPLDTA